MAQARHAATNRTIGVLGELMRGKALDRQTIAARTGTAKVTADRTIASLLACPGVEEAREGNRRVLRFDPSRIGGTVGIGAGVAAALASSLAPLFSGTTYEAGIREATQGIIARSKGRGRFRDLDRKFLFLTRGGEIALPAKAGLLDELVDALLRSERIDVEYRRFGGRRDALTLEPLSLVVHEHQLYVVASGGGHAAYAYRFARLEAVERNGEKFDYPTTYDPKGLFVDRFGIFLSDDHDVRRVRIRLAAKWATYAETNRWHPTQRVAHEQGGVTVEMSVRTCPELEAWILGFAEEAEVLEPPELRSRIADRLKRATSAYRPRGQLALFVAEERADERRLAPSRTRGKAQLAAPPKPPRQRAARAKPAAATRKRSSSR